MSDAAERRVKRASWSSAVFRGPSALTEMERDALREWRALPPLERMALTWALSVEQYGVADESMEPRLPRSAYRLERR